MKTSQIAVIIPALNEEESIALVLKDLPRDLVSEIIVVDNGSNDATGIKAKESGATVILEPEHGYGRACKAGIDHLKKAPPSIVVFLDADYSDYPSELSQLVQPIIGGRADLVLGSRLMEPFKNNSILSHAIAANELFSKLINLLYGSSLTDLGPFRAIRWDTLMSLDMRSKSYGWSSEMIVKAARKHFRIVEIPVRYRRRIGKSKISGSFWGSVKASVYILFNIVRHRIQ